MIDPCMQPVRHSNNQKIFSSQDHRLVNNHSSILISHPISNSPISFSRILIQILRIIRVKGRCRRLSITATSLLSHILRHHRLVCDNKIRIHKQEIIYKVKIIHQIKRISYHNTSNCISSCKRKTNSNNRFKIIT